MFQACQHNDRDGQSFRDVKRPFPSRDLYEATNPVGNIIRLGLGVRRVPEVDHNTFAFVGKTLRHHVVIPVFGRDPQQQVDRFAPTHALPAVIISENQPPVNEIDQGVTVVRRQAEAEFQHAHQENRTTIAEFWRPFARSHELEHRLQRITTVKKRQIGLAAPSCEEPILELRQPQRDVANATDLPQRAPDQKKFDMMDVQQRTQCGRVRIQNPTNQLATACRVRWRSDPSLVFSGGISKIATARIPRRATCQSATTADATAST